MSTAGNEGTIAAVTQVVTLGVTGQGAIGIQVEGTWVGTLQFECSVGGAYSTMNVTPPNSATAVTSTTANGIWLASAAGIRLIQIRASAWVSGSARIRLQSAAASAGSGGGGAAGAVTISDGSDAAEGSTTDAAVTGDNTGTVSAKLRGLNKVLADVWDSVNHWLKVSIQNASLLVTVGTGQGKTLLFKSIATGGAPFVVLVAADATKRIKVVNYVVVLSGAGSVSFGSDSGDDVTGPMAVATNGGVSCASDASTPLFQTGVNVDLSISVSGVGSPAAAGHIAYFLE